MKHHLISTSTAFLPVKKLTSKVGAAALALCMLGFVGESYAQPDSHRQYFAFTPGTSVTVPHADVATACNDGDGCTIRLGMINWDGAGRAAFRDTAFDYTFLFIFPVGDWNWRSEWAGGLQGENSNFVTEHVMNMWACYFTDGTYTGFINFGDGDLDFALLLWNQYPGAHCSLTIID